jgi:protein with PEP-CTERM/exosortase system signal
VEDFCRLRPKKVRAIPANVNSEPSLSTAEIGSRAADILCLLLRFSFNRYHHKALGFGRVLIMKKLNLAMLAVAALFAFVVPVQASVIFLGPPVKKTNPTGLVPVPESGATFVLLSGGLIALAALRRKLTS